MITPPLTRDELLHAGQLVLFEKGRRGLRSNRQVAASIGVAEADLSRFLNASPKVRKWSLSRMDRVAAWVGLSVDGLLGREEGATKPEGGAPPAATRRADLVRLADALADQKINFARMVEAVLRNADVPPAVLEDLSKLADSHARRLADLYDAARFARPLGDVAPWEVPEMRNMPNGRTE